MISQGFPLWAVDPDGDVFLVIGWLPDADHITYPVLVPADSERARGAVAEDSDGEVYRYTTTDPTERPETPETFGPDGPSRIYGMTPTEAADALMDADSLRERLTALADRIQLERCGPGTAAGYIREALRP